MTDLIEDVLAPEVVIRRAPETDVEIRTEEGSPPLVGISQGAVWARAEPGSAGVDLGHGSLNVVIREGTVLFDARGGAGLVIVLRGTVDVSFTGEDVVTGRAGDALSLTASGTLGRGEAVDADELAQDPFVSMNLVLDALGGVPVDLDGPDAEAVTVAPVPTGEGGRRRSRRRWSRSAATDT